MSGHVFGMLGISILSLSTILILEFGIVLVVWNFFFFSFLLNKLTRSLLLVEYNVKCPRIEKEKYKEYNITLVVQ